MHDRTNSRHAQNQGVIGWISTTDVMMLGMVLMLVLAIVIQANLAHAESERKRLEVENRSMVAMRDAQAEAEKTRQDAPPISPEDLAKLLKELESLKTEAARGREESLADRASMAKQIAELTRQIQQLKLAEAERDRLRAELAESLATVKDLKAKLAPLASRNAELETLLIAARKRADDLEGRLGDQRQINRELIGLRGKLKRTAILLDSSGSMEGDRWKDAIDVVAIWLEQIPVEEANLIVFSTEARPFPGPGEFLRLDGPEGAANRRRMIDHLRSIKPAGWTNTRDALEHAYACADLDSIILFTDGAPKDSLPPEISPNKVEAIYELIGKHPAIPINAIGVGNYFDKNLSGFLLRVGQDSKGTFLGR